jgi:hypothetical protein
MPKRKLRLDPCQETNMGAGEDEIVNVDSNDEKFASRSKYIDAALRKTAMEPKTHQEPIKLLPPDTWALMETVQRSKKETHERLRSADDIAFRLANVDFGVDWPLKKSRNDIHLM